MTKQEFLDELKNALAGEVPANVMMDSYSYYANYIDDEIRNGRSEEDVLEELGMPSLIARSIIAAQSGERQADFEYTEDGKTRTIRNEKKKNNFNKDNDSRSGSGISGESGSFSFDISRLFGRVGIVLVFIALCFVFYFVIKVGFWVLVTFGIPILLMLGIIYLIILFSR